MYILYICIYVCICIYYILAYCKKKNKKLLKKKKKKNKVKQVNLTNRKAIITNSVDETFYIVYLYVSAMLLYNSAQQKTH